MEEKIKNLNQLLCDLEIFAVKLQNYHWNVTGKGFFLTHEKLEEYYEEVRKQLDEVAENIIMHGAQPFGTMEDFVKHTQITEAKNEKIKSLEIIKNISKDLEILNKDVELIKQEADKSNDYLTSTLMDNYIEDYSKRIWMLNETIK